MWLVRFILASLLVAPLVFEASAPLLVLLIFIPPVAASVAVARTAVDNEDREFDLVTPVFRWAWLESLWVFAGLLGVVSSQLSTPTLTEALRFLLLFWIPTAALTLGGCYLGVLAAGEHLTRGASSFRAAAFTVVAEMGIVGFSWWALGNFLASLGPWLCSVTVLLVLLSARLAAGWNGRKMAGSILLPALLGVAVLAWPTLADSFLRPHNRGYLTACKSNLKNIGTALEMYSTDWAGHYPPEGAYLTPNYLKTIPECPAAGEATYTFEFGPEAPLNTERYEDYYFVKCAGSNHVGDGTPADYPQYNGIMGLIER